MPLEFDVLWDCFRPFWIPLSWNKNVRSTHDSQRNAVIMILLVDGPTQASGRTLAGKHYDDVIMGTIASQITSLTSVYSTVYSGEDQSKHQSSASLAFVWGIHRWIPRTNGQLRGKCLHLMTSTWGDEDGKHWNMKYMSETYRNLKSCEISSFITFLWVNLSVLEFSTQHGSIVAVLYTKNVEYISHSYEIFAAHYIAMCILQLSM